MSYSVFNRMLNTLARSFGERAVWQETGVTFAGRFRTDPVMVPLGFAEGLNTTTTWFRCNIETIAYATKPGVGHHLLIRGRLWEVAEIYFDDIGELGFRLLKADDDDLQE